MVDALRASYSVSDDRHAAIRGFRNVLIGATAASSLFVVGVILLGANWHHLPVCAKVCPTGGKSPAGGDVALVMLFGAIGAAIALLSTLSTMHPPDTPYSLSLPQLLVKIPAGAITAFVAVVALNSGAFSSVAITDSQGLLLFYAIVFGFAQQAATRLIDQKAADVMQAARPRK